MAFRPAQGGAAMAARAGPVGCGGLQVAAANGGGEALSLLDRTLAAGPASG